MLPPGLPMSFRTFASVFIVSLFALLVPSLARAQTSASITMDVPLKASLPRFAPGGTTAQPKRNQSLNPEGINLQDCRDNLLIRFPLNITGTATNLTGQVWATDSGANCADAVQRSGAGVQQCYQTGASFIITPTQNVDIPVKDLLKGVGDQSATTGADGCRRLNASNIDVWFLALTGSVANAQLDIPLRVDTQGPRGLSGVRAEPGDTRISIAWNAVGEGGADDVIGAQAYCDPNPVAVGTTTTEGGSSQVCTANDAGPDADADFDAGQTCTTVSTEGGTTGGGGTIPGASAGEIPSDGQACKTASFAPVNGQPVIPDNAFGDKFRCGDALSGTTGSTIVIGSTVAGPLQNNRVYAVAVAATDSFGNVGELSSPICQFPEETSDFWRNYRAAGGQAGGGFCSVEGPGVPVGSFGLLAVGIVFGCSLYRRIRTRRAHGRNVR